MLIKVEFNNARFCYHDDQPCYNKIVNFALSRFRNLPKSFKLTSENGQGQQVIITPESDFDCMIQKQKEQSILRVRLITEDTSDIDELADLVQKVQTKDSEFKQVDTQEQEMTIQLNNLSLNPNETKKEREKRKDICKRAQLRLKRKEKLKNFYQKELLPGIKILVQDALKQQSHEGHQCDGCGQNPIKGTLYVCRVCKNFDFCENCDLTKDHPHPFTRIRCPQSRTPIRPKSCSSERQYLDEPQQEKKWRKTNESDRSESVDLRESSQGSRSSRVQYPYDYLKYTFFDFPQMLIPQYESCMLQTPQPQNIYSRFRLYKEQELEQNDFDQKVAIIAEKIGCSNEFATSICTLYRDLPVDVIIGIISNDDIFRF